MTAKIISVVVLLGFSMAANAQENMKSEFIPERTVYEAVRDESGRLILKEVSEPPSTPEKGASSDITITKSGEFVPMKPMPGLESKFDELWVVQDPQGSVKGIYPPGTTTLEFFGDLPPGSSMTKAQYFTTGFWPWEGEEAVESAKETVKRQLTEMINEAADTVCASKRRPTEFTLMSEVSVSLGVSALVSLSMRFDTVDLCS